MNISKPTLYLVLCESYFNSLKSHTHSRKQDCDVVIPISICRTGSLFSNFAHHKITKSPLFLPLFHTKTKNKLHIADHLEVLQTDWISLDFTIFFCRESLLLRNNSSFHEEEYPLVWHFWPTFFPVPPIPSQGHARTHLMGKFSRRSMLPLPPSAGKKGLHRDHTLFCPGVALPMPGWVYLILQYR